MSTRGMRGAGGRKRKHDAAPAPSTSGQAQAQATPDTGTGSTSDTPSLPQLPVVPVPPPGSSGAPVLDGTASNMAGGGEPCDTNVSFAHCQNVGYIDMSYRVSPAPNARGNLNVP